MPSGKAAARMSRTTRIFTQVAVATAVAGVGLFGSVNAAQAAPERCAMVTGGSPGTGYYVKAHCSAGTGTFRPIAQCEKSPSFYYYTYGQWVGPGAVSTAQCNPGYWVVYRAIQYRN